MLVLLSGCSSRVQVPQVKVCGQPLYESAVLWVPDDVSSPPAQVTQARGRFTLALTDDCDHGVDFSVDPSDATVLNEVDARDGKVAGVYLQAKVRQFTATVTRSDGTSYDVTLSDTSPVDPETASTTPEPTT